MARADIEEGEDYGSAADVQSMDAVIALISARPIVAGSMEDEALQQFNQEWDERFADLETKIEERKNTLEAGHATAKRARIKRIRKYKEEVEPLEEEITTLQRQLNTLKGRRDRILAKITQEQEDQRNDATAIKTQLDLVDDDEQDALKLLHLQHDIEFAELANDVFNIPIPENIKRLRRRRPQREREHEVARKRRQEQLKANDQRPGLLNDSRTPRRGRTQANTRPTKRAGRQGRRRWRTLVIMVTVPVAVAGGSVAWFTGKVGGSSGVEASKWLHQNVPFVPGGDSEKIWSPNVIRWKSEVQEACQNPAVSNGYICQGKNWWILLAIMQHESGGNPDFKKTEGLNEQKMDDGTVRKGLLPLIISGKEVGKPTGELAAADMGIEGYDAFKPAHSILTSAYILNYAATQLDGMPDADDAGNEVSTLRSERYNAPVKGPVDDPAKNWCATTNKVAKKDQTGKPAKIFDLYATVWSEGAPCEEALRVVRLALKGD